MKAEIFSGVAEGGAAVINRDSPYFELLAARAKAQGIKNIIGFGRHNAERPLFFIEPFVFFQKLYF